MAVTNNLTERKSFELTTPITIGDEELNTLSFRKPTVEELCRIGAIQIFTDTGDATFNFAALAKYMTALGNIPPSTVNKMEPSDFIACAQWLVATFFLPSKR